MKLVRLEKTNKAIININQNIEILLIDILTRDSHESLYLYLYLKDMIDYGNFDEKKYYRLVHIIKHVNFNFFRFDCFEKCSYCCGDWKTKYKNIYLILKKRTASEDVYIWLKKIFYFLSTFKLFIVRFPV